MRVSPNGGIRLAKIADAVNSHAVVPKLISTGIVVEVGKASCKVDIDHSEDSELIEICIRDEVFKLRWNSRRQIGRYLFIAKAWRGWTGKRRFRVQCHRIFDDGVIWWREIIYETAHGKLLKPHKDRDRESVRSLIAEPALAPGK